MTIVEWITYYNFVSISINSLSISIYRSVLLKKSRRVILLFVFLDIFIWKKIHILFSILVLIVTSSSSAISVLLLIRFFGFSYYLFHYSSICVDIYVYKFKFNRMNMLLLLLLSSLSSFTFVFIIDDIMTIHTHKSISK